MAGLNPAPGDIPLGLYIHIPWCVRKCPYCDFNSHSIRGNLDENAYIDALISDFSHEVLRTNGRDIQSIFIGGGTPSLFGAKSIDRLLHQINQRIRFDNAIEITLEANPAVADARRFADYRSAGVNRLSIGIQSLQDDKLQSLGRLHDRSDALSAIQAVEQAGYRHFNLDLMYGLPDQTLEQAMLDLAELLAIEPPHLSWYQLTLEPNTRFYRHPPRLASDDQLADMMQSGLEQLAAQGYVQYEISAHSRPGMQCRHNLNYWQFGDYIGIGAGAHAKLTLPDGRIIRRTRQRQPDRYLALSHKLGSERVLQKTELPLEFMLNAMRLNRGVAVQTLRSTTGLSLADIQSELDQAIALGLMEPSDQRLQPTERGRMFLNDLVALFMPPGD